MKLVLTAIGVFSSLCFAGTAYADHHEDWRRGHEDQHGHRATVHLKPGVQAYQVSQAEMAAAVDYAMESYHNRMIESEARYAAALANARLDSNVDESAEILNGVILEAMRARKADYAQAAADLQTMDIPACRSLCYVVIE